MLLGSLMFQIIASCPADQSGSTSPGSSLSAITPQTTGSGTVTVPMLTATEIDSSSSRSPAG